MPAFLVLSGLGVVFYVLLLVAIYRDDRRRKFTPQTTNKVSLGVVAEIDTTQTSGRRQANQRHAPQTAVRRVTLAP